MEHRDVIYKPSVLGSAFPVRPPGARAPRTSRSWLRREGSRRRSLSDVAAAFRIYAFPRVCKSLPRMLSSPRNAPRPRVPGAFPRSTSRGPRCGRSEPSSVALVSLFAPAFLDSPLGRIRPRRRGPLPVACGQRDDSRPLSRPVARSRSSAQCPSPRSPLVRCWPPPEPASPPRAGACCWSDPRPPSPSRSSTRPPARRTDSSSCGRSSSPRREPRGSATRGAL